MAIRTVKPTRIIARPSATKRVAAKAVAVAPVPESKKGELSRQPRFEHIGKDGSQYTGPSKGFNANKSKTPFRVGEFGTQPDRPLTERTLREAQVLKSMYGANPWKRGNLDAGIGNALIAKGFVQHLSGDVSSEEAMYRFTPSAMSTKFV